MTAEELQAQKMSAMRSALRGAMRGSIQAQQERLDELEKQLDSANELDNIDKPLKIENDDQIYYVTETGEIHPTFGAAPHIPFFNARHKVFKQLKYAEMYRKKTQFIADQLHFKWLYDRDINPENDLQSAKWTVMLDDDHKFAVTTNRNVQPGDIYFSTKELAQKCADWLNRKAGCK